MVRRGAVLLGIGVAVAACSDSATAPAARHFSPGSGLAEMGGGINQGRGKADVDKGVFSQDFVVDPSQQTTVNLGNHVVVFPAHSICDPATSGYGENMWDAPCTPLDQPITIRATWSSKYGHAFIEFGTALRFVPSDDPNQWVRLIMKDYGQLDPNYSYPIFWQRPSDGAWVDEGQIDPSMTSVRDLENNKVARRLKHFSSYWIGAGESCDAMEGSCLPLSGFAGYLLGA